MAYECSSRAQLSAFYDRVRNFNFRAPLGQWKMDGYLGRLAERRRAPFDVLTLRTKLWRSAYISSLHDLYEREERPAFRTQATAFLDVLDQISVLLRDLDVHPENIARVMAHMPDEQAEFLGAMEQQHAVEKGTRELIASLIQAQNQIGSYLNRNFLPSQRGRANRTNHFIRTFAETSAIAWRSMVSRELQQRRDRSDFAGMMGSALADFGYPRSRRQVESDDWLYESVVKYKIWN